MYDMINNAEKREEPSEEDEVTERPKERRRRSLSVEQVHAAEKASK
jgi:hypothetical protein